MKDEEVEYLKSKVGEVIGEYERVKKGERETKDDNNQLTAKVVPHI
jgi:hypothetical protein